MKHLKHDAAEVVPGQGYLKRVLIDESGLGVPGSFLQEVEFRKGEPVRQHHHRFQTEIFYALEEAPFVINGQEVTMSPGDICRLRAGRRPREPRGPARLHDTGTEDRIPRK